MDKIFYLAQVFNSINVIAIVVVIVSIVCLGSIAFYWIIDTYMDEDEVENCKKAMRIFSILAVVSSLIVTFVPSRETYLLMKGGKAIEAIASNEKVQETAGKTLDFINSWLDEHTNKK